MNNIQLLQQGIAQMQAGRLAEAEQAFADMLQADPAHGAANSLMGLLRLQQDRAAEALPFFAAALERQSDPGTLINYGLALDRLGRRDEALAAYDRVLVLRPDLFAAHFNRANTLLGQERLADAVAAFDRALALDPAFASAHFNRAEALRRMDRLPEALAGLDRAAALSPADANIANSQGIVLRRLGRIEDALSAYGRALAADPRHPHALHNRALLLAEAGRPLEALADHDRLVALQPDDVDALSGRAHLLRRLARREASAADFARVLSLQPGNEDALLQHAVLLFELRRMREALAAFEAYEKLRPGDPLTVGGIAAAAGALCDWQRLAAVEPRIDECIRQGSPALPVINLMALRDDPALQLQAAENAVAEWVTTPPRPRWRPTWRHERIRLVYVSSDFRQHALAVLLTGLIASHDRSRFEVSAVALGPDDGSQMRARLAAAFDRFIPVPDLNQQTAARLVQELEADIAIDCNGHSSSNLLQLFAQRPAPVQVNYLGAPNTMGAGFYDYVLGDATATPFSLQPFFREKIVQLPRCYQANGPRQASAQTPGRAEAGLPEAGLVFACFNHSWKITPSVFAVWMRLLQAVPGSVLWLLAMDRDAFANLRSEAARHGVDPARLVPAPGLPQDQHLARHRLADLFLDTPFCNAHTTGSDALWMGLPVLTCQGNSFAARVGASLLKSADLPELITASLEDYETLALALARDPALLARYRKGLADHRDSCALFDSVRHARGVEAAYLRMCEIARAGGDPESFAVPAGTETV